MNRFFGRNGMDADYTQSNALAAFRPIALARPSHWTSASTILHSSKAGRQHALDGTLAEVRDAAGHANVSITTGYLHVAVEDDQVGELFAV